MESTRINQLRSVALPQQRQYFILCNFLNLGFNSLLHLTLKLRLNNAHKSSKYKAIQSAIQMDIQHCTFEEEEKQNNMIDNLL